MMMSYMSTSIGGLYIYCLLFIVFPHFRNRNGSYFQKIQAEYFTIFYLLEIPEQ